MGFHRMQACVVLLLCLTTEVHPSSAPEIVKNYYETLHVEATATDSQIKKSFRRLAVKYHPDKNKGTHAEKTFREIAEAYSVLSNKKKRRLYDLVGHDAYLESEGSFEPEAEPQTSFQFSFSDSFHGFDESFFVDESHFHWSFLQKEEEEENAPYERYSFEDPNVSFYFTDIDETEEEHYY
ncbi:dnaJ homolog subfamily B member 9 [Kryptolebias marmoratus]|uniref:dnaJ homolog subfamily B member 9 n=1 Tax=Kryptolebias marmoratus TaxID=37003 RepID=UPI0007F8FCA8|nr:dnaJ homolog subfamily B member 9 [Kryptolebias marmoratus]